MTATATRLSTVPFNSPGENPRNVPGYVSARALGAGAAESITIPSGSVLVRVAATADVYYSFSGAASVPTDTDDGTSFELIKAQGNPEWLMVPSGATALSVISAGTPIVTASFYTN